MVTILVAASGKLDLPKVSSQDQLVKALNRLAAVREDQVLLPPYLTSTNTNVVSSMHLVTLARQPFLPASVLALPSYVHFPLLIVEHP